MHAFSIQKMRNTSKNTHVVHEEDLVIASLSVLGVDGHDERMASLDGDLKKRDLLAQGHKTRHIDGRVHPGCPS